MELAPDRATPSTGALAAIPHNWVLPLRPCQRSESFISMGWRPQEFCGCSEAPATLGTEPVSHESHSYKVLSTVAAKCRSFHLLGVKTLLVTHQQLDGHQLFDPPYQHAFLTCHNPYCPPSSGLGLPTCETAVHDQASSIREKQLTSTRWVCQGR
jgi:hypothetical protein